MGINAKVLDTSIYFLFAELEPFAMKYSITLFDHFRPVKQPGEYFAKEWSE